VRYKSLNCGGVSSRVSKRQPLLALWHQPRNPVSIHQDRVALTFTAACWPGHHDSELVNLVVTDPLWPSNSKIGADQSRRL
jgi:hypothetical protein